MQAGAAKAAKDVATLVSVARSELGALLDAERGDGVTDHAIFDAHARACVATPVSFAI
jgi:hypothetical protein